MWGSVFLNPPTPGTSGQILYADVHRAQQTDDVKGKLKKVKTVLVNVPSGTTSRIQPLDICINKPFKNHIRTQFEEDIDENLESYSDGKITAAQRRVLITKCVANAWQLIKEDKNLTKQFIFEVWYLKCSRWK